MGLWTYGRSTWEGRDTFESGVRVAADVAAATDVTIRTIPLQRTASDSAGTSETTVGWRGRSSSDVAATADAILRGLSSGRSTTDTLLLADLVTGGRSSRSAADTALASDSDSAAVASASPKIMVIVLESYGFTQVDGNSTAAPKLTALATKYARCTQAYGVTHPSLCNYFSLVAGSSFSSVRTPDDNQPGSWRSLLASYPTILNQLDTAGIPWKTYFEGLPSPGYTNNVNGGDAEQSGNFWVHHDPFAYFNETLALSDFAARNVALTGGYAPLIADLESSSPPSYVFLVPNGADDGHDSWAAGTPGAGSALSACDTWVGNLVAAVQATPWYDENATIIITWDEDDSSVSGSEDPAAWNNGVQSSGGGGHISTIVINEQHKAVTYTTGFNQIGIYGSIARAYGLTPLQGGSNAANGNIDALLSPPAPQPPTVVGIFENAQSQTAAKADKTSIGVPYAAMSAYTGAGAGGSMSDLTYQSPWGPGPLSTPGNLRLLLGVEMGILNSTTVAQIISGWTSTYKAIYQALFTALVANGHANAILRLGWEWNGGFYQWSNAHAAASDYVTLFRLIAALAKATPGSQFLTDWCANSASSYSSTPLATWDPGAAGNGGNTDGAGNTVRDIISQDHYDDFTGNVNILSGITAYALSQDVPTALPEWGLDGQDDPAFIQNIANWIAGNDVVYQSYFNYEGPGGLDDAIQDFPNSLAVYKAAFSSSTQQRTASDSSAASDSASGAGHGGQRSGAASATASDSAVGPAVPTNLAWSKLAPAGYSPAARYVFGACLDMNGDLIVLGGDASPGATPLNDFFKYTEPGGAPTLTQLTPAHTPWGLIGAAGIRDCQMLLDPVTGNVIAFGGDTTAAGGGQTNTFSWNGTDWALLSPAHHPAGDAEYGIAPDPITGRIIIYGGWTSPTPDENDHHTWSGTDWVPFGGTTPPGRSGLCMCLDPVRKVVVMFGGHTDTAYEVVVNDTWTWNGTAWTQITPTHQPQGRFWHQMYFDQRLQMVVMFGGSTSIGALNDAWGFTGSDWVKIDQDTLSEFSAAGQIVWHNKSASAIALFGANSFSNTPSAEVWRLTSQVAAQGLNPVQFGQAEVAATSPQTLTVPLAPTDKGNFLVARVTIHRPSGSTATVTPQGSGWVAGATAGGSGTTPLLATFYHPAPPAGTTTVSFTCTVTSGNVICGATVTEFRGGSIIGMEDHPVASTGSAQSATGTAGTPQRASELAIVSFATDSTSTGTGLTTSTKPSGWGFAGAQPDSATADGIAVWSYWQVGTGAAPTASLAWTNTGGNVPFSASITSLFIGALTSADSALATDGAAPLGRRARTGSETATAGDAALRLLTEQRTAGDTSAATDAAGRALPHARAATDGAAAGDAAGRALQGARAASDSSAAADSALTTTSGVARFSFDAASAGDAASPGVALPRAASDSVASTDSSNGRAQPARSAADTAVSADSAARQLIAQRLGSSAATTSDSASRQLATARSAGDTALATDAGTGQLTRARSTADTAAAVDTAMRLMVLARSASDSSTASDAAQRTGPSSTRTASDSSTASDSPLRAETMARAGADTAAASDTATRSRFAPRASADTALAGDSAAGISAGAPTRTAADTAPATDAAGRSWHGSRTASDTAVSTDSSGRTGPRSRTASDSSTEADSASRSTLSRARASADNALASEASAGTGPGIRTSADQATTVDGALLSSRSAGAADTALTTASIPAAHVAVARVSADASSTSESPVRSLRAARSASDSSTAFDSVGRTLAGARSSADASVSSDGAVRSFLEARSSADAAMAADTAGARVSARSSADAATAADSVQRQLAIPRSASEASTATDVALRGSPIARATADPALATDAALRALVTQRAAQDAAVATDTASRALVAGRTASEAATAADSAVRAPRLAPGSAEAAVASDLAARVLAWARTVVDQASAVDAASRIAATGRTVADQSVSADTASFSVQIQRAAADGATAADLASGPGARQRTASDTAPSIDAALVHFSGLRAASETLLASDTASSSGQGIQRVAGDLAVAGDAPIRTGVIARASVDSAATGDLATRFMRTASSSEEATSSDVATATLVSLYAYPAQVVVCAELVTAVAVGARDLSGSRDLGAGR